MTTLLRAFLVLCGVAVCQGNVYPHAQAAFAASGGSMGILGAAGWRGRAPIVLRSRCTSGRRDVAMAVEEVTCITAHTRNESLNSYTQCHVLHMYIHKCIYIMQTYSCACMFENIHVQRYIYVHIYICIYVYMHIYIHL